MLSLGVSVTKTRNTELTGEMKRGETMKMGWRVVRSRGYDEERGL
jgi:hypothetical protein